MSGPLARDQVLAVIQWLYSRDALADVTEANALLAAAGVDVLGSVYEDEGKVLQMAGPEN